MDVTLGGFVLFLHISVAIAAFMTAGVLHAALQAMARARTVAEMRSWAAAVHRLDPLFPVMAVLLLGLGAWLIHLSGGEFRWSDGWVVTAVATLVVIEAAGGALIAPRAKAMVAAVGAASDGTVPDDIRRRSVDTVLWDLAHVSTIGFAGVVFLMAAKPTGWLAVVIVVVAAALGVALSRAQLSRLGGAPVGADVPAQREVDARTDSNVAS